MRDLFRGFYRPTEEEFKQIWNDCIFSFDTNILLNIYRYTPKSRERFFEILNKLKERIWITNQAAFEYHKNRLDVISSQSKPYREIQNCLDESLKNLKKILEQYSKRHSFSTFIDEKKQIIEVIDEAHKRVKTSLKEASLKYPDFISHDNLHENLTDLLDGKVGKPYTEEDLSRIYKTAEERFKNNLPPGYLDFKGNKKKQPPDCYGDLLIWFQLIDYVKVDNKPVIFVTDEDGEDWWLKHQGETISPRPELRQEMFTKAGVEFYLYTGDRFLDYASEFLDFTNEPEVIEEARDVRSQEQEREKLSAISSNLAKQLGGLYGPRSELSRIADQLSAISGSGSNINNLAKQLGDLYGPRSELSRIADQLSAISGSGSNINNLAKQLGGLYGPRSEFSRIADQLSAISGSGSNINNLAKQLGGLYEFRSEFSRIADQLRAISDSGSNINNLAKQLDALSNTDLANLAEQVDTQQDEGSHLTEEEQSEEYD